MKYKKIIFFCIAFGALLHSSSGQDLHYSQFYNAPTSISPALTGIFNGDKRIQASLRDQWRSVPVPWFTFTVGYDQKVYLSKSENTFLGLGGFFNYDKQGDSNLNLASINLSGSISRILSKRHILTGGLTLGYSTKGFNDQDLRWDEQWNGLSYDPNLQSGESFNLNRFGYLETALGLNYRYQKTSRTKMDLGIAGWHLTKPEDTFYSRANPQKLPIRLAIYGIGSIELADRLDLQLDVLAQDQGEYNEIILGGYVNIYLNEQRGKETSLRLGLGYRTNFPPSTVDRTSKALFPKIALEWQRRFFIAASYDIDLSEFNQHTNYRGGPEIHFNYLITDVKPLKQFKVCPIY